MISPYNAVVAFMRIDTTVEHAVWIRLYIAFAPEILGVSEYCLN